MRPGRRRAIEDVPAGGAGAVPETIYRRIRNWESVPWVLQILDSRLRGNDPEVALVKRVSPPVMHRRHHPKQSSP